MYDCGSVELKSIEFEWDLKKVCMFSQNYPQMFVLSHMSCNEARFNTW